RGELHDARVRRAAADRRVARRRADRAGSRGSAVSTAAALPANGAAKPVAPAAPASVPLPSHLLPIFTIAVALSTFMEVLDTSIANVAVPPIAGNLAVSPNMGTWVISSYGLA